MGWQKRYREIKETLIGETGKRALLVEGAEDESLFRILLSRKFKSDWENTWALANAGGENNVIRILESESSWVGIIDRDEWDEEMIKNKQSQLENLFVLPRFCLESYAIEPGELWEALPPKLKVRVGGDPRAFKSEILQDKDKWLRHGVLWSVINPLWGGLRTLGFKEKLLDFDAAQDDELIRKTLKQWHSFLDPNKVFRRFTEKLKQANRASPEDQVVKWIHGKQFFREHVHPILNKYLGQEDVQTRLKEIFSTRKLPDDLEPLWTKIHV